MEIYCDNAATTRIDPEVLEAMLPYLQYHYGNPSAAHRKGREARQAIETARRTVADVLHATPEEIIFTSGATEANNLALVGSIRGLGIRNVVSSLIEHKAVLQTLRYLETECFIVPHWVHLDAQGRIDWADLELYLQHYPRSLISLMHGNNELGNLNDVERIAWLSHHYGAVFHADTVQTLGYHAYDLSQLPLDFLVGSAHKFHGPKGAGFLFARRTHRIPALLHGGSQEGGMRPGTESVANIVGLAKALEISSQNRQANRLHVQHLKELLLSLVHQSLPDVCLNGTSGLLHESLPTLISLSLPPAPGAGESLVHRLDAAGIMVSGGSACSALSGTGSHVLDAIGASTGRQTIRISLGKYNTVDEVRELVTVLSNIYGQVPTTVAGSYSGD